jgi:two-component system cell cycle sensor histidine kinase/response regulator CckA
VRRVVQRIIEKAGYTVLAAGDGVEALGVLRRQPGRVRLIVSDVVMPVMDGPTLARQLRQHGDETPILWLSGYPAEYLDRRLELPVGEPVFVKPIPSSELADLVHARITGARQARP